MSEKSEFYARIYDKCPYCDRVFRKKEYSSNSKLVRKRLDSSSNLKNT
jgi:hypothetical protein